MSNWLNPDNKFFSFMGKAFDLVVINVFWLLSCVLLPAGVLYLIVTTNVAVLGVLLFVAILPIVPATTAMYYAIVKTIRKERSYAIKEFIRSFKRNFKQGALFSLCYGIAAAIMVIDFHYAKNLIEQGETSGNTFQGVFMVITLLLCVVFTFLCPVLSRFDMKWGGILKTAFFMSTRHILTTLVLLALMIGVLLGCYIVVPGMFFLPAIGTLLASFLIERVFKKYMPAKKEGNTKEEGTIMDAEDREDAKDEWYLE